MGLELLILVSFVILGVSCLIGLYLYQAFLVRLRRMYPSVWQALGRPHLISNNSMETFVAVHRFLRTLSKSMGDLDTQTVRRGRLLRTYTLVYMVFFVLLLFVVLASIASDRL